MISHTELRSMEKTRPVEEITFCRFNQDSTCLIVGTKLHGFYIYKLSPLQLIYSSTVDEPVPMRCVCVEMYWTANIMAIVQTPAKVPDSKVEPLALSPPMTKQLYGQNFEQIFKENSSTSGGRRSTHTVKPLTKKDVMMYDVSRKEGIYIITLAQNVHNVRMNMNAIAVISKHFVFLYNLQSYELIQRLTLNYHLGRVILTNND